MFFAFRTSFSRYNPVIRFFQPKAVYRHTEIVSEPVDDTVEEQSTVLGDEEEIDLTFEAQSETSADSPVYLYEGEGNIPIDEAHFPDEAFRNYIKETFDHYYGESDGFLNSWEIQFATIIYLVSYDPTTGHISTRNVQSLDGIQYFMNLQQLDCSYNPISSLNVSMVPSLTSLSCSHCGLNSLVVSDNPDLSSLHCSDNHLTNLNVSENTELDWLNCSGNQLPELNVSNNPKLTNLWCENNQFTTLNITGCSETLKNHVNSNYLVLSEDKKVAKYITREKEYNEDEGVWDEWDQTYLSCDSNVIITGGNPAAPNDEQQSAPVSGPAVVAPAPAPAPAPAAPAEPITISKTPASTKAKAKKGKVTVTWKKIKKSKKTKALLGQIKSIQVQYSTDPNFATDVNTKTVSKKKTKATLSLQRKTQYYIRVRYVGSDGVSNWGAVKAVKTK